jgi:sulfatase modifying factor 1
MRQGISIGLASMLWACSASHPPSHGTEGPPHPTGSSSATDKAEETAVTSATATDAGAGNLPDGGAVMDGGSSAGADGACPADMVLVDGDYCEDLQVKCIRKWEAPQNHLWVCEEVEQPTRCLGPTRPMRYCIDRYEFPNRKGVRPMVMQNFYQAQLHCHQRGKRVCTESEWTKACEGPDNKPFPYGYVRDPKKCHGDQPWDNPSGKKLIARDPGELERLWQGVKSGSQPHCVSDYGVHDMPANADELAASETYGKGPRSDFDNVTTGGPWYLGVRNMCRPKIYSHDESFAYYYLSWRCCQEADGKPTEPRAPKQVKRNLKWKRVLWLAHHSWMMPFNPLVPGDPGYSSSGPRGK